MTILVEGLLALQSFEGLSDPPQINASYAAQLAKLREPIPVSVLRHHSHRRSHHKLSIAAVSVSGVCGHCHLALPRGLAQQISHSGSLFSCPHCDGFLYADVVTVIPTPAIPKKSKTPSKTTLSSAVATT